MRDAAARRISMAMFFDRHAHELVRIPVWAQPVHPTHSTGDPALTNIFAVVGEHRDDPNRLLVVGEDGNTYDYQVPTGHLMPTEPKEAEWQVDTAEPMLEELFFDEAG
jgi:hypothetical protein